MAFDIYGQRLQQGFCEVHPHVQQEYPCDICWRDMQARKAAKKAEDDYWREQERLHYEQLAKEQSECFGGDAI